MILGYARVSTEQADQDLSIEAQVQQLMDAGCDRVIRERASAFKDGGKRPGWDELQALVASGQAREVVAVSQSRLSRRGEDVQFLRICARRGVTVRFLDGTPGDITDPAARLMTGVMATVNEVDSQIKSINIKNGLDRRKAAGHYACAKVPYGYVYSGGAVVPNPETFKDARLLWDQLVAAEMNAVAVIRQHGRQWSPQGLYDWIEHPILRGVVKGKANAVEPLITWEEWRAGMEHRNRRRSGRTRAPRTVRLFSGLVRCSGCGGWMHYAELERKHPRLKCTALLCQWYSRGIAVWRVRAQVIEALRAASEGLGRVAASAPVPTVSAEAAQWQQQLEQLRQLQAQGVPGLERSMDELELKLLQPAPASGIDAGRLAALFAVPGALDGASEGQLRAVLLEFVQEIVYVGNPAEVEVRVRQGL
jgi:DNA invertase Pin-like site-specific DNA recombinase